VEAPSLHHPALVGLGYPKLQLGALVTRAVQPLHVRRPHEELGLLPRLDVTKVEPLPAMAGAPTCGVVCARCLLGTEIPEPDASPAVSSTALVLYGRQRTVELIGWPHDKEAWRRRWIWLHGLNTWGGCLAGEGTESFTMAVGCTPMKTPRALPPRYICAARVQIFNARGKNYSSRFFPASGTAAFFMLFECRQLSWWT
jgi:hypothetical protein